MNRRAFLKIAMISSSGAGTLLKSNITSARGIPNKVFENTPQGKCYAASAKGVIQTSLTIVDC